MRSAGRCNITTCRRCGPSCGMRPRNDYRFSSLVLGIVKSAPFQMRVKNRQEDPMFITKKSSFPPHVPSRHGRHDRVAVARLDGAGADAARADGGESEEPADVHLHPARRHDGPVDAGGRRQRVSSSPRSSSRSSRFRDHVNVVSGLCHPQAGRRTERTAAARSTTTARPRCF